MNEAGGNDQRTSASGLACGTCGSLIQKEELAQGLAVRVDGQLVCSMCVDTLPSEAQMRINQLRAVRGLNVTTYQVPYVNHPKLKAFSFTTAANITAHRRTLAQTGYFYAPMLSANATGIAQLSNPRDETATALPAITEAPNRSASRGLGWRIPIAGGVVFAGIVIALALSGKGKPTPIESEPQPVAQPDERPTTNSANTTTAPEKSKPTRLAYASDPVAAWEQASADHDCPTKVLEEIGREVMEASAKDISTIEADIAAGRLADAKTRLQGITFPDHIYFRQMRAKLADLRGALASAEVAKPKPEPGPIVSKPEPTPKPVVIEEKPKPDPEPPEKPEPPAVSSPGKESLLIQSEQLLAEADRDLWHKTPTGGLKLDRSTGQLERTLQVSGGMYQLWIEHRTEQKDGFLQISFDDQRLDRLEGEGGKGWVRVQPKSFDLTAGTHRLQIVASGRGEIVYRLYLAGDNAPSPEDVEKVKTWTAPMWVQDAQAAPQAPLANQLWSLKFTGNGKIIDPVDERSRVPDGLPGNSGTVVESALARNKKTHSVVLDLTGMSMDRGGLALLVNPVRSDRQKLLVSIADNAGHVLKGSVDLPVAEWSSRILDFLDAPDRDQFVADKLTTLTIEDVAPLTTSFMVGKLVVVAHGAPKEESLELRPPALFPIAYRDLERVLTIVANKRKSNKWRRDFQPAQMKILVGPQMLAGEFDTMVRKGLPAVLKVDPLPAKSLEGLVMQDDWLNNKLFGKTDPVVDTAKIQVLVVCTAGVEFPIGLTEPQAFINFWTEMIDQCLEHGVLPVVVLGPNKVTADEKADAALLWLEVEKYMKKNRVGIPIIDLRPARAISYTKMAPGMTILASQLMLDGYGELMARINYLRAQQPK